MPRIQSWLPRWLSSVVIRVTSFEDVQLTSGRPALHRLLMICKAYGTYEVVANIWVWIPCIAGMPFRRTNEKLGAETGDLAMTYKLEVVAVGLCRHDVGIGDGFSWKWSIGNELWKSVVVRNLFARSVSSSCLVSTAAVGQQFVDREGSVFYAKMLEMIKKVTRAVHVHIFRHQLRDAKDNADGDGFNISVQPYVVAVHSNSSRYAAEEVFLRSAGNTVDAKFCKGRFVYINAWRNITTDPIENKRLAVYDKTSLVSSDDYVASDLFMRGARLMQYGLSDHNVAKRRWYYFPKIQMDVVLQFKQFDSDSALPGRTTFNIAFVDPTVRPDAPEKQNIECSAFLFFPDFEPNTCPVLPSDAVAEEVASHAERGTWDLWRVRELSDSLIVCAITVREEPKLHVSPTSETSQT